MPRRKRSSCGERRKHYQYKKHRAHSATTSSDVAQEKDDLNNAFILDTRCSNDTGRAAVNPSMNDAFMEDPDLTCTNTLGTQDFVHPSLDDGFIQEDAVDAFDVKTEYETLRQDVGISLESPYMMHHASEEITIIQLNSIGHKTAVKLKVVIQKNFVAKTFVHNQEIPYDHELWACLPKQYRRLQHVQALLSNIASHCVCIGNPDPEFTELTPVGTGLGDTSGAGLLAYREGDFCASQGTLSYDSTIRSVKCDLLVKGVRCKSCSAYRRCLRQRTQRLEELKSRDCNYLNSTFKHRDMPREVLIKKLGQQKEHIKSLESENDRLRRDLRGEIRKHGVTVNDADNMELTDLMASCRSEVEKALPDSNCFQRLFWEQQLKYSQSGKYGMRWHPMIIRWCLWIRNKSAKAYDAVREAGFVKLPSNRTLFDYSHYVKSELGFQPDVLKCCTVKPRSKACMMTKSRAMLGCFLTR